MKNQTEIASNKKGNRLTAAAAAVFVLFAVVCIIVYWLFIAMNESACKVLRQKITETFRRKTKNGWPC